MAGELRAPLIVLEPVEDGSPNVRANYVVVEPLEEGTPNVRLDYFVVEPLSEGYPNVRLDYFIVEALLPVYPEEWMSTDKFPGSLDSGVSIPGLAFLWHKKPRFNTNVQRAASGPTVRNALMQYPIWEFEATYDILEDRTGANSSLKLMMGFFLSRKGQFDTFLFKDSDDYSVVNGLQGVGDGVTTQFELLRAIGDFYEKIGQVDTDKDINIYADGVLVAPADYTVTMPNKVVFDVAPADGVELSADFEFFFVCKFMEDIADFDKFAHQMWELQTIEFESVPQ